MENSFSNLGAIDKLMLAFRFAFREMRGGLRGFYIFLACVALGAAAISGVNSVSWSINQSISAEGQSILGADIRFELNNRVATEEELAFLTAQGDISIGSNLRSMARKPDGSDQALVELRSVDAVYPLFSELVTEPALPRDEIFAEVDGVFGAAVAPLMLDRLNLSVGEELLLGDARIQVRATIIAEPDALSEGFGFAPRMMISDKALVEAGLIRIGSLVEHSYRIDMAGEPSVAEVNAVRELAKTEHPDAGWSMRTSRNAAPALTTNIERFSQFLTLVGLTVLVVGGVGVGNAVRAFLDSKRGVIATFKCLGASARFVFIIYLTQVFIIAFIGVIIGLLFGAIIPFITSSLLSSALSINISASIYPNALLLAGMFALMSALTFAILPLGNAGSVPATALFRQWNLGQSGWPKPIYLLIALVFAVLLAWLVIVTSESDQIAMIFMGAVVFSFIVLRVVSVLVQWIAKKSPQVRSTPLRMAIGNIHRPGALTSSVVMSLGLGLTLLVSLALIDGNLRREIAGNLPDRAPNFFFVDIQSNEIEGFEKLVNEVSPDGKLVEVPMLRGRILAFNGVELKDMVIPPEARWVTRGDRGVTYAKNLPEKSVLSDGQWWAPDYTGEPLVSFSSEEAAEIGLKIGDTVTVNVLGRTITARIANFRLVQWESLSINFVMVFSPNTFAGAPHSWLATLLESNATPEQEGEVLRAVTQAYPTVTTVRVKDALEIAERLVGQIALAIRAAAVVALVASILVLAGALAAGNQARRHDSVVLKTLGATRITLIKAFSLEYMILGLSTAIFALASGGVASWYVVSNIMNLPYTFLPDVAITTLVAALVLTVGIGLIGTWRVLGQKAAPILRDL
jgi:putative ABC transport system permease protein